MLDRKNLFDCIDAAIVSPGDYCRGWNDALEALENQPKWISVEEALPEDLEEVLILVKETEFYGQYREFSATPTAEGGMIDGI